MPGRPADRGLPERPLRRPAPGRRRSACPASRWSCPGTGIARELSLPESADSYGNDYVRSYRVRNGVLHNPRSDRRTTQGTFHVAEGGLPIPGDKKAVPRGGLRRASSATPLAPPRRPAGRALHRRPAASRSRPSSRCCSGRSSAPRSPASAPREDDGDPLLRPRRPGQQPRFRRVDLRQRRRPLPARERRRPRRRALDRPHRLRDPRPAPDPAHQEGTRPAALGRGDRAPAARRHVLARPGRAVQRRPGLQADLPHRRRRDRHADRRQLLRLLQEGGEDADLASPPTSSATSRRSTAGGALAFASYNLGDEFDADATTRATAARSTTWSATIREVVEPQPEGYAVDRRFPGPGLHPGRRPGQHRPAPGLVDARRPRGRHPAVARQDLHDPLGLQGAPARSTPAPRAGGSSAPSPRASSATSPAPSAAAARARSPRPCATT